MVQTGLLLRQQLFPCCWFLPNDDKQGDGTHVIWNFMSGLADKTLENMWQTTSFSQLGSSGPFRTEDAFLKFYDCIYFAGFLASSYWRGGTGTFQLTLCAAALLRFGGLFQSFTPVVMITFLTALLNELFFRRRDQELIPMELVKTRARMLSQNVSVGGWNKHWGIVIWPKNKDPELLHYRRMKKNSFRLTPHRGKFKGSHFHRGTLIGYTTEILLDAEIPSMELAGLCHDWVYKTAYTISTSRTLTYCVLLLQPRWLYLVLATALLLDCLLGHYQATYILTTAVWFLDHYEMTNSLVRRRRLSRVDRDFKQVTVHVAAIAAILVVYVPLRATPVWVHELITWALIVLEVMLAKLLLHYVRSK